MLMFVNMLIGVICSVVSEVARSSRDEALMLYLKTTLLSRLEQLTDDRNLTRKQFNMILRDREVLEMFAVLGVPVKGMMMMESSIFNCDEPGGEDKTVSFKDFIPRVLEMRDSELSRVVDFTEIQKIVKEGRERVLKKCEGIELDPQGNILLLMSSVQVKLYRKLRESGKEFQKTLSSLESAVEQTFDRRAEKFYAKLPTKPGESSLPPSPAAAEASPPGAVGNSEPRPDPLARFGKILKPRR
jgi:hypothetical protein